MYKVNKQNCRGCGVCVGNCPGAIKLGDNGKAEIVDQAKLEECGGTSVCPFGSIEKVEDGGGKNDDDSDDDSDDDDSDLSYRINRSPEPPFGGRGMGRGMGRGLGRGMGRGMGQGPRDGRGRGQGGGNRM